MVCSGLGRRNLIEEYEISRNVGLGIAVAGIRGVAGLGGRTRTCGWDWGYALRGSRFLEGLCQWIARVRPQGGGNRATITISGDFRLDAGLGPECASECDFRT